MGDVVEFRRHADASIGADDGFGRRTPSGQDTSGQLSENHCIVRSSRRTCMSAPFSMASSFLVSPKARQLTVDKLISCARAYARATWSNCSVPVMHGISVNLPDMSTAILPDALAVDTGSITAMDAKVILRNIDACLLAQRRTEHKVSKDAGHPDAIRNLRRAVARGKARVSLPMLQAIAKTLKTTPAELQRPDMEPPKLDLSPDQQDRLLELLLAQREMLDGQIEALLAARHTVSAAKKRSEKNR